MRDALLRNDKFGADHNMEIFCRRSLPHRACSTPLIWVRSILALSTNESVADPLTGETWRSASGQTVHLDGASIVHLRHEIRAEASTSVESSRVMNNFVGNSRVPPKIPGP